MSEGDYVLGTHEEEVERLALQHRVWRARMLEGWRRARIRPGHIVLDVGAGPGFAATDLADIVSPNGCVIALERSPEFVATLRRRADRLGLSNIQLRQHDVSLPFEVSGGDAAWCRWVLSFVPQPAETVRHIASALKPGGVAIFHEYADYSTWRMMPPHPLQERFRSLVVQSWRDSGGDPDVALRLPRWLQESGFHIVETRTFVDIVSPQDVAWQWPRAFMASNAKRLRELGYITEGEVEPIATLLDRQAAETRMLTPLVAEIVARRAA